MLKVDQYEYVRTAHRIYDKSVSEIARETGHSRNTVKKVLRGEHQGYTTRVKQSWPVLGPYIEIIEGWLEKDKDMPPKQRHTAKRIFMRLVREHGFEGSASNVRKYVRGAKNRLGLKQTEVFVPLEPEQGLEAEVDWGTATVMLEEQTVLSRDIQIPALRGHPLSRRCTHSLSTALV